MINEFKGEFDFLSNFFESMLYYNGLYYPTSEHAYQAAKTIIPGEMDLVRNCKTPGGAKRMGSRKANNITLRSDWNSIKYDIMLDIVRSKFKDPILADKLVATNTILLVEENAWHDNFWGNCVCDDCNHIVGGNWLGFILMDVRAEIILERNNEDKRRFCYK